LKGLIISSLSIITQLCDSLFDSAKSPPPESSEKKPEENTISLPISYDTPSFTAVPDNEQIKKSISDYKDNQKYTTPTPLAK